MSQLAKIHVGLKQLGIQKEDARDLFERVTGKRKLTLMNFNEQKAIVDDLVQKGFKPTSNRSRKRLEGEYAPKLQALWIGAWNLGIVRDRRDSALLAFVKRQTGLDHTRFLTDPKEAMKAIEALKGMMARDGGVDWSIGNDFYPFERVDGYKIASAQCWKLRNAKLEDRSFLQVVHAISPNLVVHEARNRDWVPVMNALGKRVRAIKS